MIASGNPYGSGDTEYVQFESVTPYQDARIPSVIRADKNFMMSPIDFMMGQMGEDGPAAFFWANADFWTSGRVHGTYIENASIQDAQIGSLAAYKIQAGTIGVAVTVGGENKIELDGKNNRILIKD